MNNQDILELNETNFDQEVLHAETPVLVAFWAGWSLPCKAMTPLLESMAGDYVAPLKIVRVNVEQHENLTELYGVRCVPTLLIFNRGGVREQIVGPTTEQAVRERLGDFDSMNPSEAGSERRDGFVRRR
jgi:thioredoxin 1